MGKVGNRKANLEPEQPYPLFNSVLVRRLQVRIGQNVVSSTEIASTLQKAQSIFGTGREDPRQFDSCYSDLGGTPPAGGFDPASE